MIRITLCVYKHGYYNVFLLYANEVVFVFSGAVGEAVPAVRPRSGQFVAARGMGRISESQTDVSIPRNCFFNQFLQTRR